MAARVGKVTGRSLETAIPGDHVDPSARHTASPRPAAPTDGARPPLPPQGIETRPVRNDTAYTVRDFGPTWAEYNDGMHVAIRRRVNLPVSGMVPPAIYPNPYPLRQPPPSWDAHLAFVPALSTIPTPAHSGLPVTGGS